MSCAKRHFWFGRCATWVVLEVVEIYARSWLAPKHCWCSMLVLVGTCWWCWSTGRHDCGPCRWLVVYREHPCWTISTLHAIGAELGFESMDSGSFTCCGKHIRRAEDHAIRLTMTAYHSNLSEVVIAKHWKSDVDAVFEKHGHKQLHAVLGSLQWLVAQIRYTTCPSVFRLCKAKASNSWNPDSSERCSTWVQTHWWLRIMCSGRLTTCQQAFALFLMQRLETSSWMDLRLELRRDVFTPKHATFACCARSQCFMESKEPSTFSMLDRIEFHVSAGLCTVPKPLLQKNRWMLDNCAEAWLQWSAWRIWLKRKPMLLPMPSVWQLWWMLKMCMTKGTQTQAVWFSKVLGVYHCMDKKCSSPSKHSREMDRSWEHVGWCWNERDGLESFA